MQRDERMGGALQENVLTVLCFDEKFAKLVRHAVDTPKMFESAPMREVAGAAMDFIDQYGTPIGEHLADHLEHILKGDDEKKAKLYGRLVENLFAARNNVNAQYVITQINKFVRLQNFKSGLVNAVEIIEGSGDIDRAEVVMQEAMNAQAAVFDGGLSMDNPDDVGRILDDPEEEGFEIGIPELDEQGIIPRRKEMLLLIAPRGRGKSWFINHICKHALLQRWSALVVTLEMSEKRYATRFLQTFFAISRRDALVKVTRLSKDRDGDLSALVQETLTRDTLRDDGIKEKLLGRAKREFKRRARIRFKQFPSGELRVSGLQAYLDGLERFEKWTPDVICVDYPDLMDLEDEEMRTGLNKLFVRLRGIGVKRNAAMVVVTQGNRASETATTVVGSMAAEDISKLATTDVCLTYSQTAAEYTLGLGRIFVEKARNELSKFVVLVSQAYAIGQFALGSARIPRTEEYWSKVGTTSGGRSDDSDGDEDDRRPRNDRRTTAARGRRRTD